MPLKVAAKVDSVDAGYFERDIRPMLTGEIEFVGEIAEEEKDEFLGRRLRRCSSRSTGRSRSAW